MFLRPDEMFSKIRLAASGVAETGVFPVEVLMKAALLSMHILQASEIRDGLMSSPLSIMILTGMSAGHSSFKVRKNFSQAALSPFISAR